MGNFAMSKRNYPCVKTDCLTIKKSIDYELRNE